ncbi:MAG: hypothetical protein ABMA64_43650, partial [Myxococcota bacterium]
MSRLTVLPLALLGFGAPALAAEPSGIDDLTTTELGADDARPDLDATRNKAGAKGRPSGKGAAARPSSGRATGSTSRSSGASRPSTGPSHAAPSGGSRPPAAPAASQGPPPSLTSSDRACHAFVTPPPYAGKDMRFTSLHRLGERQDMRTILTRTWVLILAIALMPTLGYAQTDGRFTGTVLDPSGSFISGATVSVKNEKTGDERTVTT